ncbi:cytochrome c [Roseivivax marinus]|jgi:cytochrome c556|uniref:Cytochrome c n=1 Tax=Roseivivax marinus TaxID=1379903 RepID=W4HPR2_9RHOB|nr:cytochrome c [Roseivivax marinus]ETW14689.1 cytochrome c [Roseivivax marinus]UMA66077.1 cytochrome c [Roseivivax marinus]SEL04675.1 Cytochrome c556 [Roseivivax marinus]
MFRLAAIAATAVAIASPTLAQDDDFEDVLTARQGMFRILAINLGIIGDMAKGDTEYDAEQATMAADNLHAVSMINPLILFPEGSDAEAIDGTRALPAIWENTDDVGSKWADLGEAVSGLQEVAGDGREALGPALGPVGNACKACHDEYRASE